MQTSGDLRWCEGPLLVCVALVRVSVSDTRFVTHGRRVHNGIQHKVRAFPTTLRIASHVHQTRVLNSTKPSGSHHASDSGLHTTPGEETMKRKKFPDFYAGLYVSGNHCLDKFTFGWVGM
jgi:hypothetical protein